MNDLIVILIIVLIISLALYYIYKEKKKGVACIGCPYAKQCQSKKSNCQSHQKN